MFKFLGYVFCIALFAGCSVLGLDDAELPRCVVPDDCEGLNLSLPESSCEHYTCGEISGRCMLTPLDSDSDGSTPLRCGGSDCDDENPLINERADEVCGNDLDEDCDGFANDLDCDGADSEEHGGADCDDFDDSLGPHIREICGNNLDEDCDGYANDKDCDGIDAIENGGRDCDDNDRNRNHLEREICNGIDDDCNDELDGPDEDNDGDGHADECAGPGATDCDDTDPLTHYDAREVCDGWDNDCLVDGLRRTGGGPRIEPQEDLDGDSHASPNAHCFEFAEDGTAFFPRDDCDDTDASVYPGAPELCDGLDNDCDGIPDNELGAEIAGGVCRSFASLAAGGDHTCVLRHDGHIVCFGLNDRGQLGVEQAQPFDAVLIPSISNLTEISTGDKCGCALHDDGTVTCFGPRTLLMPGRVEGNGIRRIDVENVSELSAGAEYACAVINDEGSGGEVSCWGASDEGEIDGVTQDVRVTGHLPSPVASISDAISVDAGDGVTCAVRASGNVYCWGDNEFGQLGNGESGGVSRDEVITIDDAEKVACGDHFACALRSDGTVWCWGIQLGSFPFGASFTHTPEQVSGLSDIIDISAGTGQFACALNDEGRVFCWGDNSFGQLGGGTSAPREITPVEVPGLTDVETLSVGGTHACVLAQSGRTFCWGNNLSYQLGLAHNRPTGSLSSPTVMTHPLQIERDCFRLPDLTVRCGNDENEPPESVENIVDFAFGTDHECYVELSGEIRCFGSNGLGQLGVGKFGSETVFGISDSRSIDCGANHCCTLRETGRVACWGDHQFGQLGIEEGTEDRCFGSPCSKVPRHVEGLADISEITSGNQHSCALTMDGRVACWGDNSLGQVGAALPGNVILATFVEGLPDDDPAVDLETTALGSPENQRNTTCAVLLSGTVMCWGEPLAIGLDGGPDPRPLPGMYSVLQIAMNENGLCARLVSGAIQCIAAVGSSVDIEEIWDASRIGAGSSHYCVMKPSGQAVCFGLIPAGIVAPTPIPTATPLPVVDLFD